MLPKIKIYQLIITENVIVIQLFRFNQPFYYLMPVFIHHSFNIPCSGVQIASILQNPTISERV